MKKALLLSSISAMAITSALAATPNFNVGVYGGGVLSSSTNSVNYTSTAGTSSKKTDLGGAGAVAGVSASCDYALYNNIFAGVDLFGAWHNYDAKQDSQLASLALNTKVKMRYSVGTALKFGYMFDKATAFARVGYINSYFEHFSNYVGAPKTSKKKKNASGLLLGAGVDLPVSEKIIMGLSYDFALYQKQTNKYGPFNSPTATVTNDFKARMHFVNVAVKYKF